MKYTRLTKRDKFGVIALCNACPRKGTERCTAEETDGMCCINEQQNRLAELEDKIEQGKMFELPCKVGDTVYYVVEYDITHIPRIKEVKVERFSLSDYYKTGELRLSVYTDLGVITYNENLFLTREEAEKRLKELKNG